MNNILSIVWHIIAIISMSFLTSCASNNVELPKASIRADKTQIVAPSMSSDFTVSLKANCNWGIIKKDNDAADWLTVTPETGMGNADIVLSLTANKSGARETIVTFNSTDDPSQILSIHVKQSEYGSSWTISDLRALSSNLTVGASEYTITEDKTISGIVNTASLGANLPGGVFGIQDSKESGSGIMVRTKELSWYNFGEEIKIPVKGSILTRDENGILELRPAGDVDIVRTETSKVQLNPTVISYSDYISKKYESMYVAIEPAQAIASELMSSMDGSVEFQDTEN